MLNPDDFPDSMQNQPVNKKAFEELDEMAAAYTARAARLAQVKAVLEEHLPDLTIRELRGLLG
jgi:hypothetical protein